MPAPDPATPATEPAAPTEPVTGVHRLPLAARPICGHGTRVYARGLCRSCHRKLSEHGLPLPPCRSRWDGYDGLAAWVRSLPDDVRRRLSAALMEV